MALAVVVFMVGCDKSPDQYDKGTAPSNKAIDDQKIQDYTTLTKPINISGQAKPANELIGATLVGEELIGGSEFDAKVKANSSLPVLYDIGAGGVDYATTLEMAETSLSTPRSPPDVNGDALYDEGLYIRWRLDAPRTPVFIMVLTSYLGKLQLPSPMAPIGINHDFSNQYPANSKSAAEQMAQDYYRIFEKAPATYNCLTTGKCSLTWGTDEQKDFILSLPGIVLLVSKDRMVLYRMMIIPTVQLGILDNNIDVLKSEILVPNEAPISLGSEYADIEARWAAGISSNKKPNTSVGTNNFGRNYTGGYMSYEKTKFDRKAVEALPDSKLKAFQVWGEFSSLLTVGGNPIMVKEVGNQVDVRVGTAADLAPASSIAPVISTEIPLQINMGIDRQNVKQFAEKLQALLFAEFQKAYPAADGFEVNTHFAGGNQQKQIKEYTVFFTIFNAAKNDGLFVQFSFEEERGNVSSYYATKLGGEFSPLDSLVLPEFNKPLTKQPGKAVFDKLSGIAIGDVVKVTDWDLGRAEATVTLEGVNLTERASYGDQGTEFFAFSTEKTVPVSIASVYISSLNVSLGLIPDLARTTATERYYKVSVVRSALKKGEIQGLCGGALQIQFGMDHISFLKALNAVPGCVYLPEKDEGGNGILTRVYFPNDRLRLSFGDFELTMATVYAAPGEVK